MASPDGRVRVCLGNFRRRQVMLWSPLPVSDCVQRLVAVTTSRGPATWYLDPRTVGRPEPRFRGQADQRWIRLARFQSGAWRNSFLAVLDARPEPGADGGTAFSGWAGRSEYLEFLPVLTAGFGLASLGLLAAGIAQLAAGHLIGLVPAAAFWLPVAAVAGFNALGHRSLERDISALLQEVNEVLGPAAVSAGPAADSDGA